ncbi:MAG: RNA polymerase factor sigma-54 [Bacillota bacterium]|nr:RNA polymerase factor sigma-54 [Bacillota bacterium]
MRPGLTLKLEQSARLIMTPQLKQAIELLQMNTLELDSFLRVQIAENPVFEFTSPPWEQPAGLGLERVKNSVKWDNGDDEPTELYDPPDSPDPRGELLLDISLSSASAVVKRAAEVLVYSLDSRGYLPEFAPEFIKEVGFSRRVLVLAQRLLQAIGPPGFGTQNLVDCLLTQLYQRGALTPLTERVVRDYLPLLGARLDRVAQQINVSLAELGPILESIKACDPSPGSRYCLPSPTTSVIPDVYILRSHDGFAAHVNQSLSSRLVISDVYRNMAEQVRDGEAKSYIDDCMRSALWVMRAVEQRRETLLRITQALIKLQYGFLAYGTAYLRPLTLAVVATEIGVHESTVSRAVSHKQVLTPRGLLPLKTFFDSGVKCSAGGIAAEAVKERIAKLIGQEDRASPLSDEQITTMLKNDGIQISRRTVAKYRESLSILSSAGRR